MRARRLVAWWVIVLLAAVPAVRFAGTPPAGVPHHDSVKSARSSPSGWRTGTVVPTFAAVLPVLGPRPAESPFAPERLMSIDPAVPFVPPRA